MTSASDLMSCAMLFIRYHPSVCTCSHFSGASLWCEPKAPSEQTLSCSEGLADPGPVQGGKACAVSSGDIMQCCDKLKVYHCQAMGDRRVDQTSTRLSGGGKSCSGTKLASRPDKRALYVTQTTQES